MKQFVESIEGMPLLVKIILALPPLYIIWSIYRIVSALDRKNISALVVSVILFFIPITWIFDLVMVLLTGNVWKLA